MSILTALLRKITRPKNVLFFLGLQLLSKQLKTPYFNKLLLMREFYLLVQRARNLKHSVKAQKRAKFQKK